MFQIEIGFYLHNLLSWAEEHQLERAVTTVVVIFNFHGYDSGKYTTTLVTYLTDTPRWFCKSKENSCAQSNFRKWSEAASPSVLSFTNGI